MWQKLAFTIAAAMPLAGCASSIGAGPSAAPAPAVTMQAGQSNLFGAVASDYALVSVDGHALPYTPRAASDVSLLPTEIVGGTLTLRANGAFTIATTYRELKSTGLHSFDSKFSGACAPEGDAYRMFWEGGGNTQLAISGDTVMVNNGGVLFRFLKAR